MEVAFDGATRPVGRVDDAEPRLGDVVHLRQDECLELGLLDRELGDADQGCPSSVRGRETPTPDDDGDRFLLESNLDATLRVEPLDGHGATGGVDEPFGVRDPEDEQELRVVECRAQDVLELGGRRRRLQQVGESPRLGRHDVVADDQADTQQWEHDRSDGEHVLVAVAAGEEEQHRSSTHHGQRDDDL